MKQRITLITSPKEVQTKNGPKQKFSIKTTESGDNYLGVWMDDTTRMWRTGDIVDITVTENGKYHNAYPVKEAGTAPFQQPPVQTIPTYTPPPPAYTPEPIRTAPPIQATNNADTMPWDPTPENMMRAISEIRREVTEIKALLLGRQA